MRKESRKEEYDYEKRREDVHLSTIFYIQTDLTVSCIFITDGINYRVTLISMKSFQVTIKSLSSLVAASPLFAPVIILFWQCEALMEQDNEGFICIRSQVSSHGVSAQSYS